MKWMLFIGLCIIQCNALSQGFNALNVDTQVKPTHLSNSGIFQTNNSSGNPSSLNAIASYSNDFEQHNIEIYSMDFEISAVEGLNGKVLHTPHPYPTSLSMDSSRNLTAQLMYPIILKKSSTLSFDEIVLVEPSSVSIHPEGKHSIDYVVVEASKDGGKKWFPITERYNSEIETVWKHIFTKSIFNYHSYASASQNIFKTKSINLTEHDNLSENDIIFIRFRLASDYSIAGWGWAIDNLKVSHEEINLKEDFREHFNIFPNPCKNQLFVECIDNNGPTFIDIIVMDMSGTVIYQNKQLPVQSISRKNIDLSNLNAGIYTIIITDGAYFQKTKKIVKI